MPSTDASTVLANAHDASEVVDTLELSGAPPTVNASRPIRPAYGDTAGGTYIEVTGTNLTGGTATIDGVALTSVTVSSDGTLLRGRTPAHARGNGSLVISTAFGTTAPATFGYIDVLTIASPLVWWDADNAVNNGSGLATSIPNMSGVGDGTRNLLGFDSTTGVFYAGLLPHIYANDLGTHASVGDSSPGATGRAFVNNNVSGGALGPFTTALTAPFTIYILAYITPTAGGTIWLRMANDGTTNNVAGLHGTANPSMTAGDTTNNGVFSITPGWHVICCVHNGASSYVYLDDPAVSVIGPANLGPASMTSIFTGSFYNDPVAWKWTTHFAHSGAHDYATRATLMMDYLADRYRINRWRLMTSAAPWLERDGAHWEYIGGKLRLYGGWRPNPEPTWNNTQTTNEEWSSTDDGATWTQDYTHTQTPPTAGVGAHWGPRHTAGWTRATVGGTDYLYCIGGDFFNPSSDVWRTSDGHTWTQVAASSPWGAALTGTCRVLQMCGQLNGNLYIMGGQVDTNDPTTARQDVWMSGDGGANWTQLSNAPWAKRGMVYDLVTFNGYLWVIGGGTYSNAPGGRTYYNDVWKFDGTTWTQVLANGHGQWTGREYHNVKVFDGKLWILGGWNDANNNDVYFSSDGATWTRFDTSTPTPWAIEHASGVAVTPAGIAHGTGNALDKYVYRLELHE